MVGFDSPRTRRRVLFLGAVLRRRSFTPRARSRGGGHFRARALRGRDPDRHRDERPSNDLRQRRVSERVGGFGGDGAPRVPGLGSAVGGARGVGAAAARKSRSVDALKRCGTTRAWWPRWRVCSGWTVSRQGARWFSAHDAGPERRGPWASLRVREAVRRESRGGGARGVRRRRAEPGDFWCAARRTEDVARPGRKRWSASRARAGGGEVMIL